MNTELIRLKYSNIEEMVPSVWPDYERVAIDLAQDVATLWDIKDPEIIRVLALVDMRVAGMGLPSFRLSEHIHTPFAFAGLYPNVMKTYDINGIEKPE